MKNFSILIIPFLYCTTSAIAQSITPIVFSSADNFVTHSNFSVSSTLGNFMSQTFIRIQTTNNSTTQILYAVEKGEVSISVYPNPSLGTFYVNISGSNNKEVLVVLRDVLGKAYYSKIVIPSSDMDIIEVNPENKLAPGVYCVIVSNADNVFAKKIVIDK